MKIIPSPDWFIGLDSYDLCQHGHWINTAELKVSKITKLPELYGIDIYLFH